MTREEHLQRLNPTVVWKRGSDKGLPKSPTVTFHGTMEVPSGYENSFGRTFNVGLRRLQFAHVTPKIHMIFLAGGPGGYSQDLENFAQKLIIDSQGLIAGYLVDHRGLGESGEFFAMEQEHFTVESIGNKLKAAPFDVKDLTMENASLDIAMLGLALEKEAKAKSNEFRLVLWGFSYGAQWAHHTVQLAPNLFDSAILGGISRAKDIATPSGISGLAEMCSLDPFCRSKMGGDVMKTIEQAATSIVEREFNACTRLLHDQFVFKGSRDVRIAKLGGMFHHQFSAKADLESSFSFRPSQIILPFIKATYDCIDPERYRDDVLRPIIPHLLDQSLVELDNQVKRTNLFVNGVVLTDIEYSDFKNGPPTIPKGSKDIYPTFSQATYYYSRWQELKPFLQGRKVSKELPIVSSKTHVYIAASRMDLVTPYLPAWDLYLSIKVPQKSWLLYDNRSHDSYRGSCMDIFLREAICGEVNVGFDYENAVEYDDSSWKLDWTFKDQSEWKGMWDMVKNVPHSEPVIRTIPKYKKLGSSEGATVVPSGIMSANVKMIGCIGLFIACTLAVTFYYVWLRRRKQIPYMNRMVSIASIEAMVFPPANMTGGDNAAFTLPGDPNAKFRI
jgi:pimeloyl-ACP methyl ester carboxylesterase